jgi:dipeptidase E
MAKNKKLLLISNSYAYGGGYLKHAEDEIKAFLSGTKSLLFIPYALANKDDYSRKTADFFRKLGIKASSIHNLRDTKKAVQEAQAIFIGGGNTFRLLNEMYKVDILDILKTRINEGKPFIGSSAETNVAAPTIKTTNDMPIVEPPSLNALGIINFQINPHYLDSDPSSKHMGETREKRLEQYLEENDLPVVGLREGAWLRIENNRIYLGGKNGARLFQKEKSPKEYKSGSYIKTI